jgi:hypothetical protein
VFDGVPPVIAGQLSLLIGNQGYLVGTGGQHKVNELLLPTVTLNIEFGSNDFFERYDIAVSDMSFVGAGVNSNTVGPHLLNIDGYFKQIGVITSSGITQGSELVDVNR